MAITIDENMLSPKARLALGNAKNKSKLLREAFEAYINMEPLKINQESSENSSCYTDPEIKNDIKEIKEMLYSLHIQGLQAATSITEEIVKPENEQEKHTVTIEMSPENKTNTVKNEPEIVININEKQPNITVKKETENANVSEQKNLEVENMLSSSISQFVGMLADDEDD